MRCQCLFPIKVIMPDTTDFFWLQYFNTQFRVWKSHLHQGLNRMSDSFVAANSRWLMRILPPQLSLQIYMGLRKSDGRHNVCTAVSWISVLENTNMWYKLLVPHSNYHGCACVPFPAPQQHQMKIKCLIVEVIVIHSTLRCDVSSGDS